MDGALNHDWILPHGEKPIFINRRREIKRRAEEVDVAGCAGAGEVEFFVVPAFVGGDEDVSALGGGEVAQELEDVRKGEVVDEFFADDEVGLCDGLLSDVGVLEGQ